MKFDVHGDGARCFHGDRGAKYGAPGPVKSLVVQPIQKPALGRPVLKNPADRATRSAPRPTHRDSTQSHGPPPTIPRLAPPSARRSPRTRGLHHGPLRHAALRCGDVHRPPAARRCTRIAGGTPLPPEHQGTVSPASTLSTGTAVAPSAPLATVSTDAFRRDTASSRTHPADGCRAAPAIPRATPPTSADRRAVSVESVSGDGSARSSSENCVMRAGAGSSSMATMSTAGPARRRRDGELRDRAAAACAAPWGRASARAAAARARASRDRQAQIETDRDRAAIGALERQPTADRAAARTRTTTARARRSATRAPGGSMKRGVSASGTNGRGSSPRASRCSATPAPSEPRRQLRRPAAPPDRQASQSPSCLENLVQAASAIAMIHGRSGSDLERRADELGAAAAHRRHMPDRTGVADIAQHAQQPRRRLRRRDRDAGAARPRPRIARRQRRCNRAAARRSAAPRPDTSSSTSGSLTTITRGEKSRATTSRSIAVGVRAQAGI